MKIELELQPFTIPAFVIIKMPPQPRQAGFSQAPAIALSELNENQLNALCDEFRAGVMAAAKKKPTNTIATLRGNSATGV